MHCSLKILLLLSLCLTFTNSKKKREILYNMNTDPLFDGTGQCTTDEIEDNFCLPFKDLTFSDEVWESDENDRIVGLNEYIEDNYIFKKKFVLKKDNEDEDLSDDNLLHAYMKEDADKFDILGVYYTKEELLHSGSLGRSYFKKFEGFEMHKRLLDKMYMIEDNQKFPLVLLYHLYHIKHSKLAADLQMLPKQISTPMFTLTDYELNTFLFEERYIYELVKNTRQTYIDRYYGLVSEMESVMTMDEMYDFLNGRDQLPLQDFIYASYIMELRAVVALIPVGDAQQQTNKTMYFMLPGLHHLQQADEWKEDKEKMFQYDFTGRDEFSLRIMFLQNVQEDSEIQQDMGNLLTSQQFLINGKSPETNINDCITIKMLSKEMAQVHQTAQFACLSKQSTLQLKHFLTISLVTNMDELEIEDCQKKVKKQNHLQTGEERNKYFFEHCDYPTDYPKFDYWKDPMNEIEYKILQYETFIENLHEYKKLRVNYQLSTLNADLIVKYMQTRIKVAEELKAEINKMIEALKTPKKSKKRQAKPKIEESEKIEL